MRTINKKQCEKCVYWEEPESGISKCCTFPWFDWTEDDKIMALCQTEEAADGENE